MINVQIYATEYGIKYLDFLLSRNEMTYEDFHAIYKIYFSPTSLSQKYWQSHILSKVHEIEQHFDIFNIKTRSLYRPLTLIEKNTIDTRKIRKPDSELIKKKKANEKLSDILEYILILNSEHLKLKYLKWLSSFKNRSNMIDFLTEITPMETHYLDKFCIDYVIMRKIPYHQLLRGREAFASWAGAVKYRDGYKCRKCGNENNLHAHHILSFSKYPEYGDDINNGVTLCLRCHKHFHKRYGKGGGFEALYSFLGGK